MTNAAHAFSALGDPTRRKLLERLSRRPMPVGKLAHGLPVSRPAVSQHLKVLKHAGLVTEVREGTRHVFHIDPRGLAAMRGWLDKFWDQSLTAFQKAVQEENDL